MCQCVNHLDLYRLYRNALDFVIIVIMCVVLQGISPETLSQELHQELHQELIQFRVQQAIAELSNHTMQQSPVGVDVKCQGNQSQPMHPSQTEAGPSQHHCRTITEPSLLWSPSQQPQPDRSKAVKMAPDGDAIREPCKRPRLISPSRSPHFKRSSKDHSNDLGTSTAAYTPTANSYKHIPQTRKDQQDQLDIAEVTEFCKDMLQKGRMKMSSVAGAFGKWGMRRLLCTIRQKFGSFSKFLESSRDFVLEKWTWKSECWVQLSHPPCGRRSCDPTVALKDRRTREYKLDDQIVQSDRGVIQYRNISSPSDLSDLPPRGVAKPAAAAEQTALDEAIVASLPANDKERHRTKKQRLGKQEERNNAQPYQDAASPDRLKVATEDFKVQSLDIKTGGGNLEETIASVAGVAGESAAAAQLASCTAAATEDKPPPYATATHAAATVIRNNQAPLSVAVLPEPDSESLQKVIESMQNILFCFSDPSRGLLLETVGHELMKDPELILSLRTHFGTLTKFISLRMDNYCVTTNSDGKSIVMMCAI